MALGLWKTVNIEDCSTAVHDSGDGYLSFLERFRDVFSLAFGQCDNAISMRTMNNTNNGFR